MSNINSTYILGKNAEHIGLTYYEPGADKSVQNGPFGGIFAKSIDYRLAAYPKSRGIVMDSTPIFRLLIQGKKIHLSILNDESLNNNYQIGYSKSFNTPEEFNHVMSKIAKVMSANKDSIVTHHPATTNKLSYGDTLRPLIDNIGNNQSKLMDTIFFLHDDVKDHIAEQGFGPVGWFKQRSQEFIKKFRQTPVIRSGENAYFSGIMHTMFDVPLDKMMDALLDVVKDIDPEAHNRLMSLTPKKLKRPANVVPKKITDCNPYLRFLLSNAKIGSERHISMVRGHVKSLCDNLT